MLEEEGGKTIDLNVPFMFSSHEGRVEASSMGGPGPRGVEAGEKEGATFFPVFV